MQAVNADFLSKETFFSQRWHHVAVVVRKKTENFQRANFSHVRPYS